MLLSDALRERNLPALTDRDTMLDILQREIYGYLPPKPDAVSFDIERDTIPRFCGGKAYLHRVTVRCVRGEKEFSFPFFAAMHDDGKRHPFFVHINFRENVPDRYMPTEELTDNGFDVLSLCYEDVTSDDGDFTNGLAGVFFPDGRRAPTDAGKIALWAWAAQRVMDWAEMQPDALDLDCAVVCGHSRLGKTALFTAATDMRFAVGYSNDSGCSGAALARGTHGETVRDIYTRFPFWFCERYGQYVDHEADMPFDQHFLIASIAPRLAMAGSAAEDDWADPLSEQLGCLAAAPAFPGGFVCPDRPAQPGEAFLEGGVGYHLRYGRHCFTREDWHQLIRFVELHKGAHA